MRAARLYYACAGAIILHSAKWYVFENLFCSAGHSCRWGRGVSGLKIRTDPCGTPVKISLTKDIFLHGQTFFFLSRYDSKYLLCQTSYVIVVKFS